MLIFILCILHPSKHQSHDKYSHFAAASSVTPTFIHPRVDYCTSPASMATVRSRLSLLFFFFCVGPKVLLLVAMLLQRKQKKFDLDEPVNMVMLNLEPHVHIHGEKSQRRRKY